MSFSAKSRNEYLENMAQTELDLLVIGGGITGAGIALDSVLRNMKVGLVEMQDFAAGTSSRSTKLIHGGLRYLKQLEVHIVAEVGKERAILYENAPHVTTPEWMILPFYKGGTFGKFFTSIGLRLYDFLAGVKKSERRYMLDQTQTLQKEPLLKKDGLIGSGVYVEYRTDDARLTMEVIKEAANHGALVSNFAKVEEFLYQGNKVIGVLVRDLITNKTYEIRAKKIVNATGPWADTLREKDHSKKGKHLLLTKGVHLVFDQSRFPLHHAIYFDTPDKRMVFAIPREGKTYLGTTDTVYEGDIQKPRMTDEDQTYLLNAANSMFPQLKLTKKDIESGWTGLRPLIYEEGKSPSEVSRKDEIFVSLSGLITIAGGKLTGYRKMAEKVVDLVMKQLEGKVFFPSQTRNKTLSGGEVGGSKGFVKFKQDKIKVGMQLGLTEEEANRLVSRYGSNIDQVYSIIRDREEEGNRYGLSKEVFGSLIYGLENEMVLTPIDFFMRRTGSILFNRDWAVKWKDPVVNFMSDYFGWTQEEKQRYIDELETEIKYSVETVNQ
ncbi:glycerol-3-phosphate dehydrogenase/oxidase [Tepidibacillus fermentans]|uniref:Aerobic glycerol-3-phosphate dehydrogenase n=1 Tax=Tepidibacillus fermentans TaxID=1281767 RepID=A0A4R3K6L9_9BACI|nr:FAD-dependent oxidoreductase [Tepidibacillus fermentans]TCS78465.1 homodimeric glycerol 3-phosphate dehydrogenase (quinone) [Tepidibacillus fermentans]